MFRHLFFFFLSFLWVTGELDCAASCSQLNASKSQGFLDQPLSSATASALSGNSFTSHHRAANGQAFGGPPGLQHASSLSAETFTSIMPSRLRSVTGQLAVCPSWAECTRPSRCWQLLCGIMPPFRGHQKSSSIQVSSVSLLMLCRQGMGISPVTQKKKKKAATILCTRHYAGIRSKCVVWLVFAHWMCQHLSAWCCVVHLLFMICELCT